MSKNEHISRQFEQDLGEVRALVIQMGALVENQVRDAIGLLEETVASRVEAIIANDHRVNALEVQIDEECDRIVALRQPAASDMRTVMAIVKIVTDLERIGDEAKNIAHIVQRHLPNGRTDVMQAVELRRTAESARGMLRESLGNFEREDFESAVQMIRSNQQADNAVGYIVRPLVMEMMEAPANISAGLDVMFISKAIERISAHAVNISEHVVYLVKGKDVRHMSMDEIERKISD